MDDFEIVLILQTVHWRGDTPAAANKFSRGFGVHLHDRAAAQKAAEYQFIPNLFPDGGD